MKGDIILFKPIHREKAEKLVEAISNKINRLYEDNNIDSIKKLIIGMGGGAGTGKTEISYLLRELLYREGYRVQLIQLDDYYYTDFSERNNIRKEKGINSVGIHEIDWELLNGIIQEYLCEELEEVESPIVNKFTNSTEILSWNPNNVDILMIEGLYALNIECSDLKIYLEGSISETKDFRLERKKEEQNAFRDEILVKEYSEVKKLKNNADIIVDFEGNIL